MDWALVGGVNLCSQEESRLDAQLKKGRFLSPTRRCHTFSASADGYARSSGGAMLLLRRSDLPDAWPVLCKVVGTAVSQNRRQQPISAVDGDAQERCIRAAIADAGLQERTASPVWFFFL